nr:immunoglobulin heavy chain junction region [Macaca mulatta]MOV90753.1 immunoglobulin heavy chain junction region [Macaca mulatta]
CARNGILGATSTLDYIDYW